MLALASKRYPSQPEFIDGAERREDAGDTARATNGQLEGGSYALTWNREENSKPGKYERLDKEGLRASCHAYGLGIWGDFGGWGFQWLALLCVLYLQTPVSPGVYTYARGYFELSNQPTAVIFHGEARVQPHLLIPRPQQLLMGGDELDHVCLPRSLGRSGIYCNFLFCRAGHPD
jgi:hypothetical protein